MITRLQLDLSHLQDYRFKQGFQDYLCPVYSRCIDVETTVQYLLYCLNYLNEGKSLLDNIKVVLPNFFNQMTVLLLLFFFFIIQV